ncbi:hypothetical protein RZS08_04050, partial [Arthrospira platensis SPKY1]|nr:hypothetical protein [Arthrospira platensis SPKY1]
MSTRRRPARRRAPARGGARVNGGAARPGAACRPRPVGGVWGEACPSLTGVSGRGRERTGFGIFPAPA